ncbi:MAG: hypothetical protein ACE5DM_01945 [Candidatus Nanoarchaeia archaeon]
MSKKSSTREAVRKRLQDAIRKVFEQGLIGKSFTSGVMLASMGERYDIKDVLHDATSARKILADIRAKIEGHDIEASEGKIWALHYNTIDGFDHGYRAIFKLYLLLEESLDRIDEFKKRTKLSDKASREVFGPVEKQIHGMLFKQQRQVNGIYAAARGGVAVSLTASSITRMNGYTMNYLRMKRETKDVFKKDKRLKTLLAKRKSKNFKKDVQELLREEIDQMGRALTDLNTEFVRLAKAVNEDENIVSAALPKHELPRAFVEAEHESYQRILGLVHKQAESMHKFINQDSSIAEKLLKAA